MSFRQSKCPSNESSLENAFDPKRCTPNNIDTFLMRRGIVRALRSALPRLSGSLLDVGCGRMPYKNILLGSGSAVERYIGLDMVHPKCGGVPDVVWDGCVMPLTSDSFDSVVATEVFEHSDNLVELLSEISRVLKPGGVLFFTTPFVWPFHDAPGDECRYTPFSLKRHLKRAGFEGVDIRATGGWHATLANVLGLWARRRPATTLVREVSAFCVWPLVMFLAWRDKIPEDFESGPLISAISGIAVKKREV